MKIDYRKKRDFSFTFFRLVLLISSNNVFVFVAKHAFSLLFRRSGYHCIICGIFVGNREK